MRPQFACGVTSKSEKEPGEIGEDFRGDRREPVVGHVQPPKDRALGLFCGDTQKVKCIKNPPEGFEVGKGEREGGEKVAGEVDAFNPGGWRQDIILVVIDSMYL